MTKQLPRNAGGAIPSGWPEEIPLPTLEEAKEAVRRGERDIVVSLESLRGKLEGTSPEMFNAQITL